MRPTIVKGINIVAGVAFVIGTIFFIVTSALQIRADVAAAVLAGKSYDATYDMFYLFGCLLYLVGTSCYLVTALVECA